MMRTRLLSWMVSILYAASAWTASPSYNYFAPGGALSCTGNCTQQSVNMGAGSSFITNQLPSANQASCAVNTQSGVTVTYTLVLSDADNCIAVNATASGTITIPLNASVNFPIGTRITVNQTGVGPTSVVGASGVTVQSGPLSPQLSQFASVTYTQMSTDTWDVSASAGSSYQSLNLINTNSTNGMGGRGFSATATAVPALLSPSASGFTQRDMIIVAGQETSSGGLNNNGYFTDLILGGNGDAMAWLGFSNPIFWILDGVGNTVATTESGVLHLAHSVTGGSGTGNGIQIGVDNPNNTRCAGASFASTEFRPAPATVPCVYFGVESGYGYVDGAGNASAGVPSSVAIAMRSFSADRNTHWLAVGGTNPVKFVQAVSTGSNQSTTTVGDTNASSITNIVGGSAANTQVNGVTIVDVSTAQTLSNKTLSGHIAYAGSSPAVSACGTSPSIDAHATDTSGTVTVGTIAAASCTVTFASAYTTWNHCRVTSQSVIASFAYSYTLSTITVTGTSLVGDLFDYDCDGS